MSIKFCEIQKFVTSVIIGATTMEQLKIDIESVNVNLTEEINKKINDSTSNIFQPMSIKIVKKNFNYSFYFTLFLEFPNAEENLKQLRKI